jgi:hypothetical protein
VPKRRVLQSRFHTAKLRRAKLGELRVVSLRPLCAAPNQKSRGSNAAAEKKTAHLLRIAAVAAIGTERAFHCCHEPRIDQRSVLIEEAVMLHLLLLILLVLLLVGALPTWPYSRSWGYYPSGGVGTLLIIVILLLLFL